VRKHDRKRTLGKPKNGLEVNIKMDLTGADWMTWTILLRLRIGTNGGFSSKR
jgi:hypothetical protein